MIGIDRVAVETQSTKQAAHITSQKLSFLHPTCVQGYIAPHIERPYTPPRVAGAEHNYPAPYSKRL
jgi:hypothetical protein